MNAHKCKLKLIKNNGRFSHSRKWGGTLIFQCEGCKMRRVFKKSRIRRLVLGKSQMFQRNMECGKGYWVEGEKPA